MNLHIAPLRPQDRAGWGGLARGYKAFYETPITDAELDTAWRRLLGDDAGAGAGADAVFGLAAHAEGRVVGITHYLFHTSTWAPRVCYLQDLFTLPEMRGQGVARALIAAVGDAARVGEASRCYWLTHETNATARRLYDRVARYQGFIRYELSL